MNKGIECKRCGQGNLVWNETKAGKWYLGEPSYHTFEDNNSVITHYAGHQCNATPEQEAKFQAEQDAKKEVARQEQEVIEARKEAARVADAKIQPIRKEQGEKVEVVGDIVKKTWIDTAYGQSCLIVVRNENHIVKMFTTAKWADDVEEGKHVVVVGEIKGWDDYDGLPNTILKRPKLQEIK